MHTYLGLLLPLRLRPLQQHHLLCRQQQAFLLTRLFHHPRLGLRFQAHPHFLPRHLTSPQEQRSALESPFRWQLSESVP